MPGDNVVLIGFMGVGKSTIGRVLARRLGRCFVETDDVITAREGRPVPEIFRRDGEARFRQLEGETLEALALKSGDVIATGGGLPCQEGRMARLRELGTVIWLKDDLQVALERARRSGARPMLTGRSFDDLEALYRQREPYYRDAQLSIDTTGLTIDQVVARILSLLRGREKSAPQVTGGRSPLRSTDPAAAHPNVEGDRMPPGSDRNPTDLGAAEAARSIRGGTLSPVALVEACLARVRGLDGGLQAWVHVDEAGARAAAQAADREGRAGRLRGVLHGVPVGIKDIIHVAGMPTRAGAATFAHSIPAADATAVARLRAAGAIILGKTHTTQFAFRDPAPTRNPWHRDHTPGGSSAGSAAAVAARMAPLALGTQTVGSVLRPAAYCGVMGFKGTHGVVPVDGVIPLAWSYDHVGVFARAVEDVALAFEVLSGESVRIAVPARAPRIAVARELVAAAQPEVAAQVSATADVLARSGATLTEVKLPAAYAELRERGQIVVEAEAAAYHAENFAKHADDYAPGIAAGIRAGLAHAATTYIAANRARLRFRDEVMALLADCDALLAPVAPSTAPAGLGSTGDASLCAPWSWTGVPAIALPTGLDSQGLPHSVQLVQAAGADGHLLSVAAWCERVLAFTGAPVL